MSFNTPQGSLAQWLDPAFYIQEQYPCVKCDKVQYADDMRFDDDGDLVCEGDCDG